MRQLTKIFGHEVWLYYPLRSIAILLWLAAREPSAFTENSVQTEVVNYGMQTANGIFMPDTIDTSLIRLQKKTQIPITVARYTRAQCEFPAVSFTGAYPTPAQ